MVIRRLRLVVMLFALFTALMTVTSCHKKPVDTNQTPEKPTLLFLIDEGISNKELISYYGNNNDGLHQALDNIFTACTPLKEKYDVGYLVYAHYFYSERGYSTNDPVDGLARISPLLINVLDYFEQKGEKLYIEAYSSGVYTNQNGELGSLPLVPIHYGDTTKIKGFTMDVEAIKALKEAYPDTFVGLRFHELVGSDGAQNT